MLKALELVGFKSFADKTRFEFPRGITVVVGPNGSGKSNIVDAIKWVLGEQSVKSLRGKEMADVIFNGSASRKPVNCAETTLTFDNSTRLLALDTPEVHITRRVYRSGEGEYLINREPCRLKDIKELFAGTGVATEAYSVIEQGKVDVLLQASPRERRMIFEEAAGISRFKAKKLEALRRLERVEQNLLRLSDIVDEVESRLRAVRLQAGKARRYKEYADRLQELRTQVGLADWRRLSDQLAEIEAELKAAQDEASQLTAEAEDVEAQALSLELQIGECDQAIRASEAAAAENRERIAKEEATIEHERRRSHDLEEEIARHRRQLSAMNVRAGGLEQQLSKTTAELDAISSQHRETALRLAEAERLLTRITAEWDQLRAANERTRQVHLDQLRAAATLGNQISALEARVQSTQIARDRAQQRLQELGGTRGELAIELEQMRGRLQELVASASERHKLLRAQQAALAEKRRQLARTQQELAALRQKHAAAAERALLLEELEKRLEGLSAGVKELLQKARGAGEGPLAGIRGVVADLLSVNIETAPLIEVALGEMAQHVVVEPSRQLVEHLQQAETRFSGRVGLIRLDVLPPLTGAEQIDLTGQRGVLGRADRFVETAPDFAVLAKRLLGKTWIVETLGDALLLQQSTGKGLNFVTRACELLSYDGCLAVGPRHTSTGLISRRSELRALRGQIADMASKIASSEAAAAQLEAQIAAADLSTTQLAAEHDELAEALSQQRLRTGAAEERHMQLDKQHAQVTAELTQATGEHDEAAATLTGTRQRLTQTELKIAETEQRLGEGTTQAGELEQTRLRHNRETGAAKVELAKSEQQIENLRALQTQLQRDQQERSKALSEARTQLILCNERALAADRSILRSESATALLYLRKESLKAEAAQCISARETFHSQRGQLLQQSQQARGRIRKLESKLHAKGLVAADVRHERTTLSERLREDYGIELAEIEHQPTADELVEREAIEAEIADLRSKVNSIGGVNLDALTELDELELRFESLSSQYRDLSSAKASLEQIIGKINADSRRLFAETLEVVRGHFQSLFRKLFGGGQADIVLDEGVDILESGIEIVARPPGKEPRNISLLSGGEKTLTCVALLLAIFRSRPSPFCVLDEVDAALDEANIQRFIGVLQEFLAWTQFIVVTHSKKTMTCASTLYGVTMQESGISKRVSVRFEDVSDTGEINSYRDVEAPEEEKGDDETQAA